MSDPYQDGRDDGKAGRDPAYERLALGANYLNDYERGYIESGSICPECKAGKHGNCDGTAWDVIADEPDECDCLHRAQP